MFSLILPVIFLIIVISIAYFEEIGVLFLFIGILYVVWKIGVYLFQSLSQINLISEYFQNKYYLIICSGLVLNLIIFEINRSSDTKLLPGSNSSSGRFFHVLLIFIPYGLVVLCLIQLFIEIIQGITKYFSNYIHNKN
jgi:hypothetical protein